MTEKEIFYNMLEREIHNLMITNPILSILSTPIKKWIVSVIDPYISLFFENDKIQIDMASDFLKEEMNAKIENFKKNFEEKRKNEKNQ